MTDKQFFAAFDLILVRGIWSCAWMLTVCLVAFASSCCGRVIIP